MDCNLTVFFCLILFSVSGVSKSVHQTPSELILTNGDSAILQCSNRITGYDRIIWYKQTQNQNFQLLGYIFSTETKLEPEFSSKLTLLGNGNNNGTLTIKSLMSDDTAKYFCAAYAQCFILFYAFTKIHKPKFMTTKMYQH